MKDNILELYPDFDHNLPPRPYRVKTVEDTQEETQTALDLGWYDVEEPRGIPWVGIATVIIFDGFLVGAILGFCNYVLPWLSGLAVKVWGA